MQAINRELLSVLSDATIRFVVPVYQRSYAWERQHWARLWDDVLAIALEPDKEHFTGSIVWVGKMQGPGINSDGNILVDGRQRLSIVNVTLDPLKDNPQLVFEAMNSTGKPLCHADLIRNFVFLGLPVDEQAKLYHNYWRQIELALGTDQEMGRFDKFIFHYLAMHKAPAIVSQAQSYQEFKDFRARSPMSAEQLLQDLLFHAHIYATVAGYRKDPDADIAEGLETINIIEVEPVLPLLMYLYGVRKKYPEKLSGEEFIQTLRILETYVAWRALCSMKNSALNRFIPTLLAPLKENIARGDFDIARRLAATLEDANGSVQEFPGKEAALKSLKSLRFYKMAPNRRKFFLAKLENSYHPKNRLDIMDGVYSVEHIMPQKLDPATDWPAMLGENYEDRYSDYLHLLGNLTLTAYNSELSNMGFAQKKEKYLANEPLSLLKSVLKEENWTFDVIERRTAELAERLVSLWKKPSLSRKEVEELSLTRKVTSQPQTYISLTDIHIFKGLCGKRDFAGKRTPAYSRIVHIFRYPLPGGGRRLSCLC